MTRTASSHSYVESRKVVLIEAENRAVVPEAGEEKGIAVRGRGKLVLCSIRGVE